MSFLTVLAAVIVVLIGGGNAWARFCRTNPLIVVIPTLALGTSVLLALAIQRSDLVLAALMGTAALIAGWLSYMCFKHAALMDLDLKNQKEAIVAELQGRCCGGSCHVDFADPTKILDALATPSPLSDDAQEARVRKMLTDMERPIYSPPIVNRDPGATLVTQALPPLNIEALVEKPMETYNAVSDCPEAIKNINLCAPTNDTIEGQRQGQPGQSSPDCPSGTVVKGSIDWERDCGSSIYAEYNDLGEW